MKWIKLRPPCIYLRWYFKKPNLPNLDRIKYTSLFIQYSTPNDTVKPQNTSGETSNCQPYTDVEFTGTTPRFQRWIKSQNPLTSLRISISFWINGLPIKLVPIWLLPSGPQTPIRRKNQNGNPTTRRRWTATPLGVTSNVTSWDTNVHIAAGTWLRKWRTILITGNVSIGILESMMRVSMFDFLICLTTISEQWRQ